MFRNLIFDWSGTLCDDIALTIEATNYVLEQYNRNPLSHDDFRAEFQLPYPNYYAIKVPEANIADLETHYRVAFDNSKTEVELLAHALDFLKFCTARGIRCFILTSMDSNAFALQNKQLDTERYFEHIHSGILNKEDYIATLMQQHGLKAQDTAFIGDMQHDVHAAHCAGVTAIGLLTGYNNAAQISEARPDILLPDLAALQQLMQRCPAPAPDSIILKGLELDCHIGVPDEERACAQRLLVDIELVSPLPFVAMQEDIECSINYFTLSQRLVELAQEEPIKLIETLASKLAACCVEEFGALEATIELHKFIMPNMSYSAVRTSLRRR